MRNCRYVWKEKQTEVGFTDMEEFLKTQHSEQSFSFDSTPYNATLKAIYLRIVNHPNQINVWLAIFVISIAIHKN